MTLYILICLPFASFPLNSKKVTLTGVVCECLDLGCIKAIKRFAEGDRYYYESWFMGDRINDIFSMGLLEGDR